MDDFQENQRKEDEFLYHLGRALTNWQWVESAAFLAYQELMEGAPKKLISFNWFYIQSFDSRISLLDGCAFFSLEETTFKEIWTPLKRSVESASQTRNRIVHGTFGVDFEGRSGVPSIKPNSMDAAAVLRKKVGNPLHEFDRRKLQKEAASFKAISHELRKFTETHLRNDAENIPH